MYILYTCMYVYVLYICAMYYTYINLVNLGEKDSIKNSVIYWHGRKLVNTELTRSVNYDPISNQIQLPVRSRNPKATLQSLKKNVSLECGLGGKKTNPVYPGEVAPGIQLINMHHLCHLAPWQQVLRALISQGSEGSPAVIYRFIITEEHGYKGPARASLSPNFEMQQNRRKYWLQLRHSPGTKDLQLCYLNLYIFMYFIFFLNFP